MSPFADLDGLSHAELKALVAGLLAAVAALRRTVGEQRDEIARLKGLKGRPAIKPSGMEKASEAKPPAAKGGKRSGGGKTAKLVIDEERVVAVAVPAGSRCKGHASFVVQDLVLRAQVIRYRRERWLTPDGRTVTAPLPAGVDGHFGGHFGPALRRFVLAQCRAGDRPPGGPSRSHLRRRGGVASPSPATRHRRSRGHPRSRAHRHRGRAVGQRHGARLPAR